MVRIADGQNISSYDQGGRLSLSSFVTRAQEPKEPSPLESLERLLSNPVMQPVIQQGARLIAAYADKLTLDNQEKLQRAQAAQTPRGPTPHRVVFGAGAPEP